MLKHILGIGVIAAAVVGCGDGTPAGPPTVDSATTRPPVTTTQPGNLGGFGSPAQANNEFGAAGTAHPVRAELRLAGDGCWYARIAGSDFLMVFPSGFGIAPHDPALITAPDGATYRSGTSVDGTAFQVGFDHIPGGDAGRWGNYTAYCDPDEQSLAVFDSLEPAFDPATLGPEAIEALALEATFTESWPCGRGWAVSTSNHLVALYIYQKTDAVLAAGTTIFLPDDDWEAQVIVGKHLFVNHCDDVFESWEPDQVIGGRWQLTAGSLEVLDDFPEGDTPGSVRAVLTGAEVVTDTGATISFDSISMFNRSFNFFAG